MQNRGRRMEPVIGSVPYAFYPFFREITSAREKKGSGDASAAGDIAFSYTAISPRYDLFADVELAADCRYDRQRRQVLIFGSGLSAWVRCPDRRPDTNGNSV